MSFLPFVGCDARAIGERETPKERRLRRETMGFLPFVGCDARAIGERSPYAAASSVSYIASSMSTATTRDTPGSCIVMPRSWFAISIVILLWLMKRNCDVSDICRTRSQKRPVL